jgi:methylmalonyl-CoA mutase cobalamin-binding domain/chain
VKSRPHPDRRTPRILTAVPICDGHDSAIVTINLEFARHGVEVIYLGYHRSVRDIVRAAIQEDVQAIGISSYNGGHIEFLSDLLRSLRSKGAGDIGVFGGGGGTITPGDARLLKRRGVDEIFFAGTSLETIVEFVHRRYGKPRRRNLRPVRDGNPTDIELSKLLTAAEGRSIPLTRDPRASAIAMGITGPGGAGKTTLIDELVLRFLKSRPGERLAILSHDPSLGGKGALLGDRAAMVYAQNDRVFARSLGTRGKAGGLARATRSCVEILKHAGFALVLVESAGIGQEDVPFAQGLVDKRILVMSPEYGSRLQLQKIVMLEAADIVVVNKTDLPGARTALAELEQRLGSNQRRPKLIGTMAKRHADPGVDALFAEVVS